ncbi:MAG: hypothetical protein V4631_05655 [Pseudomonadota bacterium]
MNIRFPTLAAFALVLAGCAPVAPHFESNFGNSVRASVSAQVADPAATRNRSAVTGIDGPAAQAAQENYEASFRRPSAPAAALATGSGK